MSVVGGMVYMLGRNQEKTEAAAREVIERSKADPAKIKVVTAFSVTFSLGHVHDTIILGSLFTKV